MRCDLEGTNLKKSILISPYGGELKDLVVTADEAEELKPYAENLPSVTLSDRALCDLELLATGAFSPLDRFMGPADSSRVIDEMRLASGHIFPIPVTLPVPRAASVRENAEIALRDSKQNLIAVLRVEEIYEWSRVDYCRKVLLTES